MKSYTDLKQSKKLAKFLPLDSADMCYQKVHAKQEYFDIPINVPPENQNDLHCWSLTALLVALSKIERGVIDICFGGYQGVVYAPEWFCSYEELDDSIFQTCHSDSPIDACYEMVIKLHEQKKRYCDYEMVYTNYMCNMDTFRRLYNTRL